MEHNEHIDCTCNETCETHEQIIVTEEAKNHLYKTVGWMKFLAVMTFIGAGCLALYSIFMFIMIFVTDNPLWSIFMVVMTVFLVAICIAYFYVGAYMNRFINRTTEALMRSNTEVFTLAMKAQSRLVTLIGWITILSIVIAFVSVILSIAFGVDSTTALLNKESMEIGF